VEDTSGEWKKFTAASGVLTRETKMAAATPIHG
jgi:hypothetical protein